MKGTRKDSGTMETRLASIGRRVDRLIKGTHNAVDRRSEPFQKERLRVEEHLSVSRAQIRQDLARTRNDFATAVENELDVWRGRDELHLQKALGAMEGRDRLRRYSSGPRSRWTMQGGPSTTCLRTSSRKDSPSQSRRVSETFVPRWLPPKEFS